MMKIRIDNTVSNFENEQSGNIAEILTKVCAALPPNRVITKLTFDGKNLSELGNDTLGNSIDFFDDLQIQTADKTIWAATGVDISLSCLESVQRSLIRAAELFREVDKARANQFFVHCIDGLERFLEAIAITKHALNLDLKSISVHNGTLLDTENTLLSILKTILSLQENKKFDSISDIVEYELITNLHTWSTSLKQIRNSQRSNS